MKRFTILTLILACFAARSHAATYANGFTTNAAGAQVQLEGTVFLSDDGAAGSVNTVGTMLPSAVWTAASTGGSNVMENLGTTYPRSIIAVSSDGGYNYVNQGYASAMLLANQQGTNYGLGMRFHAGAVSTIAGGFTEFPIQGGVGLSYTEGSYAKWGTRGVTLTSGSFTSTNRNNGSSSVIVSTAASVGNNVQAANNAVLISAAVSGTNYNSGNGAVQITYADSVVGNAVNTGARSVVFGSGFTNDWADTFLFSSRGTIALRAGTNGVDTTGNYYGSASGTTNVPLNILTNAFSGPTNTLPLGGSAYFASWTPMEITGLTGLLLTQSQESSLCISNNATTNITVTLPAAWKTPNGADSFEVTNAEMAMLSVKVWPGLVTNASWLPLR